MNLEIPDNLTEEELIAAIKEVAARLCLKYSFPGHTPEDIMQIALMEGIDRAHKWDGKRPLKNFLAVVIDRRLFNYKRDNYIRLESPCKKCPLKAYIKPDKCKEYKDRMDCDLFSNWQSRNRERQNINNAMGFDIVKDANEKSMHQTFMLGEDIDDSEVLKYINENIDIEYRKDYLVFMAGGRISSQRKTSLIEHIRELLCQREKQLES